MPHGAESKHEPYRALRKEVRREAIVALEVATATTADLPIATTRALLEIVEAREPRALTALTITADQDREALAAIPTTAAQTPADITRALAAAAITREPALEAAALRALQERMREAVAARDVQEILLVARMWMAWWKGQEFMTCGKSFGLMRRRAGSWRGGSE